jgi:hypothetical protein
MMDESLDQAIDRVQYAISNEIDRRLIFVLGSGVSIPEIPSTEEMIAYFEAEVGAFSPDFRRQLAALDPPERYRTAALQAKQRRGDRGLAAAVRKAVLNAYRGGPNPSGDVIDSDWTLSSAQAALAKVVGHIPTQQLGPIFTTNFDPLTEVALRTKGLAVTAVATPATVAFPIDQIYGSLPIVHLHGYWQDSATLSTVAHLEKERQGVEEMLHAQFRNALVVVLGYGGWNDSFYRAFTRALRDGRFAALDAELVWASPLAGTHTRGVQRTSRPARGRRRS